MIAATETFEVFVNDNTVGKGELVQHQLTIIPDIRLRLKPGDDVLAVSVETVSEHVAPALRARLVLETDGLSREILSGSDWKASGASIELLLQVTTVCGAFVL